MTYNDAIEYIHSLTKFGSMPGLDRIRRLLCKMGNPQDGLTFVHVAGTNGKGSVSSYISSVLCEEGKRTGLYISPFVVKFNERIQIDGRCISDDDLARYTEYVRSISEKLGKDCPITEFEFITALAFRYYADKKCDVVVLEVGLGGRLDATNVIKNPAVSVITKIDLDHTAILGDTIEKIAFEKCGIIKPGCPVVTTSENDGAAEYVVREIASSRRSRFVKAGVPLVTARSIMGSSFLLDGKEYSIAMPGVHQVKNAATALAAIKTAFPEISYNTAKIGIEKVKFAARCELIREEPLVLLDGSHNPNGTSALDEVLTAAGINGAVGIVGFMADKDVSVAFSKVSSHFLKLYTVTVGSNKRTMSAEALAEVISRSGKDAEPCGSYAEAIDATALTGCPLIVFGSLYLSSDIRPMLIDRFGKTC